MHVRYVVNECNRDSKLGWMQNNLFYGRLYIYIGLCYSERSALNKYLANRKTWPRNCKSISLAVNIIQTLDQTNRSSHNRKYI